MREILQKWLYETLGIRLQIKTLGKDLSDGIIFAKLLSCYKVVNEKVIKHLLPSDNPKVCEHNLREISVWFNILDIKFDNEIINQIINGRTTTCLKLLYELYLALNDKKRLHFVNAKKHQSSTQLSKNLLQSQFLRDRPCKTLGKKTEIDVKKQHSSSIITVKPHICMYSDFSSKEERLIVKSSYDKMRLEDIQFVRYELNTTPGIKSFRKTHRSALSDQLFNNEGQVNEDFTEEQMKTLKTPKTPRSSVLKTPKTPRNSVLKTLKIEPEGEQKQSSEILALDTADKPAEITEQNRLLTQMSENILQQSDYEKQLTTNKLESDFQAKIDQTTFLNIKKTDNESVTYDNYFSTCKTSEEEITYQLEAIKRMELHRKLYNEKIRKRNKKRLAICQQIMKDIVDLTIKISEYGKNSVCEELLNEWKEMLTQNKPILKDENETEDKNIPIINIDNVNIHKPTITDDDFDEYNHLIGDWFGKYQEDVSYDDLYVLGHIVYRLEQAKKPPIIPLIPANIPKYRVASILSGTFNELQIIILKTLLVKPKICVVDVESAIKFCIKRYELEADIKPPEIPPKKGKKLDKSKSGTGNTATTKKSKISTKKSTPILTCKDEEVQTTASLLDNSSNLKQLSTLAEIGMQLYNLQTFNDVSVEDVTNLLVEFLKTQVDIDGWVLINFPSTLYEAYNLEKVLSGKKFPNIFHISKSKKNESIASHSINHTPSDEDHDNALKPSKLVYLPPKREEKFCTYFKSFINVIKNEDSLSASLHTETNTESKVDSSSQISAPFGEMYEEEEAVLDVTTFYKKEGIVKNIYYKTMDFSTLKDVARAILQCDNDIDKTPSNEIFGEEVINYYGGASATTNAKQSGKASKKSANKKTPKGKDELTVAKEFLEHLSISMSKSAVAATESVPKAESEKIQIQETDVETSRLPSHEGWEYAEFLIADENKIALANLWEEMETNYINEVKNVLQRNKEIESVIPLYIKYIDRTMNDVYNDNKISTEKIVEDFLQYFNRILETKPLDETTLDQLSNDVFSMERQLWTISEERRNKSEKNRRHIIDQNWVANEIIAITNNYLSLLCIEANRCNKTLEILYNYYSQMSFIQPQDNVLQISLMNGSENDCHLCKIKFSIAKMLTDEKELNLKNPAYNILTNAIEHYFSEIGKTKSESDYIIDIYDNFIKYRKEEHKTQEMQKSKRDIYQFSKHKRESEQEETDENLTAFLEAEDIKHTNMLVEWRYVAKSELDRLKWRINVIKEKAIRDLDSLERQMTKVFYAHYNKIITSYLKENECIDNLCTTFHSAMKRHLPVKGDVIANGICVYIEEEAKSSSFENMSNYRINQLCFSVEQLQLITNQLKAVAPNGIIAKRTLRFIVEDMICIEQSPENVQLFPEQWKNLSSKKLIKLFADAFGMTSKIYWKHFILSCLDVRFPDIQEIIDCREQFLLYDKEGTGTISRDDYTHIRFWYQEEMDYTNNQHKLSSVKHLLFSLFEVDKNIFGYIAFLLMFSKDESSAKGFGKALACFLGKAVIVSNENAHLEDTLTEYNDLLCKMVKNMLNEIITNITNYRDGIKLEELVDTNKNIDIRFHPPDRHSTKTNLMHEHEEIPELSDEHEERRSSRDKESQTVSLTELLYDQYITKNKLYKWTTKVPSDVIITFLKSFVFPVLEFHDDITSTENLKRELKQTVTRLEVDGYVYIPSLMEETSIHSMFLLTRIFQIFSFPSAITQKLNEMCFQ